MPRSAARAAGRLWRVSPRKFDSTMLDLISQLDAVLPTALEGSIVRTSGMTAAVADFAAPVGALVTIERQTGSPTNAEVIGFRDDLTLLYMHGDLQGIRRGNRVRLVRTRATIASRPSTFGPRDQCPRRLRGRQAATGPG